MSSNLDLWRVAFAAVLLCGCSAAPLLPSGFLGDYSQLGPAAQPHPYRQWFMKPGVDWNTYHSVLLEPVTVHPRVLFQQGEPQQMEITGLARYFQQVLQTELRDVVTDQTGPGVLRIRVAITEVTPASPGLNAASTLIAFVPLDMGGAAIEAEFLDAATGERVAALADRKRGSPLSLRAGFSRLGHAQGAFREWAEELRKATGARHARFQAPHFRQPTEKSP